ncbi:uncharacterized protein VTP21DRAFT_2059 [Calcarisporiella thermophila]|uniref:uncharacterized protein n=1 Tax=Calcarisporiella thermophila TaxID=911321 RepID=UPI003742BE31
MGETLNLNRTAEAAHGSQRLASTAKEMKMQAEAAQKEPRAEWRAIRGSTRDLRFPECALPARGLFPPPDARISDYSAENAAAPEAARPTAKGGPSEPMKAAACWLCPNHLPNTAKRSHSPAPLGYCSASAQSLWRW